MVAEQVTVVKYPVEVEVSYLVVQEVLTLVDEDLLLEELLDLDLEVEELQLLDLEELLLVVLDDSVVFQVERLVVGVVLLSEDQVE